MQWYDSIRNSKILIKSIIIHFKLHINLMKIYVIRLLIGDANAKCDTFIASFQTIIIKSIKCLYFIYRQSIGDVWLKSLKKINWLESRVPPSAQANKNGLIEKKPLQKVDRITINYKYATLLYKLTLTNELINYEIKIRSWQ